MERNIKLLAIFNFFTDLKFHSAILILYFVQVTGSFSLGMSIFAVVQLFSALFEIPTGIFSDFIGRKNTLVIGTLFAIMSAILYAIGLNYWCLFFGAISEGLSRAWYSGNNDALLHDSLRDLGKKEFFDHYYGRISSMFQMALAIGAVVGSVMAYWSFSLVMWLSVIPQVLCMITGLFIIEPKQKSRESSNIFSHLKASAFFLWKNKILRLVSLQDILAFGVNESTFQFRAAFIATLWPTWAVGISKMLSYLAAMISYWYGSRVIQKLGAFKTLYIARIWGRLSNFSALLYPTLASPIIMPSSALIYGAMNVAITSIMQKEFTNEQRATIASLNSFLGSIFYSIFSLALGFIADQMGPRLALLIAEFFMLPVLYISWKLHTIKSS